MLSVISVAGVEFVFRWWLLALMAHATALSRFDPGADAGVMLPIIWRV